jgi:hypothetical protein
MSVTSLFLQCDDFLLMRGTDAVLSKHFVNT